MDVNQDENQDHSSAEQMNPVNLVTRIKHEAEEPSSTLKEHTEMFDFVNSFRKRRRGRGRYVPYISSNTFEQTRIPFNCSTNGVESNKKIEAIYPGTSMNCKHFSCPNCKIQFQNRDSLAMHMMESVRLEGCQSQKISKDKNNCSLSVIESPSVSRPPFTAHFENGCREKSIFSTTNNNNSFHDLPRDRIQPTCYLCKVCGEGFLNLDTLAMHMFVHVQQETCSKESLPSPKTHSIITTNSVLPLPDSPWNNQFNSALYFKNFLSNSISDRQRFQQNSLENSIESHKSRISNKHDVALLNEAKDRILHRNCKSAPICDGTSEESLRFRSYIDKLTKTQQDNANYDNVSNSPNNAKESFDSDIHFLSKLHRCNHCRILFEDLTTYCLHMGLHNVNNPWQCNMCGKKCADLHDFTVHSLHF